MHRIVTRTLIGCGFVVCCALGGCSTKAQNWTFTDAQGTVRNLTDFKGNVLVIGFSNTWCEPCQEAGLQMQALQERFSSQGVKVLSVSSWEHGDPREWMTEHGYNYGLMLNGTEIARQYNVDRIPTYLVVGFDGKVVYRHEGFEKGAADKIAAVIDKQLRKHGGDSYAKHEG